MFLKRIEILGFKSFADRTVIQLSGGISALLGPNGCGKSNFVDAIKWVLGEQSARTMRADRMEDVIFSGTQGRKALSVAEVTLVIENENRLLDLDHPEISIRRRLYRDGESEYTLNGASVRLKEIREIFYDTGVGKSAYSIMEQGRIDQVLSTKPEERRYLFEEAAGITKYKLRRGEADRKLARTSENLVQVENILREVQRHYDSLEKQTAKTLEYRKLKDQIFQHERNLRLLQWQELLKVKQKKETLKDKHQKKLQEVEEKIQGIKETLETELGKVNTMETQLIEGQKHLYGIDLEMENHEEQIHIVQENREELKAGYEVSLSQERALQETLAALEKRIKSKEEDIGTYKERLKEIENRLGVQAKTIQNLEARQEGNAGETRDREKELVDQEAQREDLQEKIRKIADDIVQELDRGLAQAGFDRSGRQHLEKGIEERLKEIQIRLGGQISLLGDILSVPSPETGERVEAVSKTLKDLTQGVDEVCGLFKDYKDSTPDFLGEFLAPEGIITRKRELDEKIRGALDRIKDLRKILQDLKEERVQLAAKLREAKEGLEELRVAQAKAITQAAAAQDALAALHRELESEQERLKAVLRQNLAGQARIKGMEEQIQGLLEKRKALGKSRKALEKKLGSLESGISHKNERMVSREVKLRQEIEKRSRSEIDREKADLEINHVDEEIRLLMDDFRERNGQDLETLAPLMEKLNKGIAATKEVLGASKQELKVLGPVNLMAPEEFTEVAERHKFLSTQLEDIKKAKEDLLKVTQEIVHKSSEYFLQTFGKMKEHYHDMFRSLFGGGRAEVKLTDPEDPLNSGIEIYAQPPGKKLENISLLSGGERSLCGIALMFATFQVRPSPFYILDEIDAALDEANIQRFLQLLAEFGKTSQFIVITHNKKTVVGASTLLGITMQESGVSRLISLRLDGQEVKNEQPDEKN